MNVAISGKRADDVGALVALHNLSPKAKGGQNSHLEFPQSSGVNRASSAPANTEESATAGVEVVTSNASESETGVFKSLSSDIDLDETTQASATSNGDNSDQDFVKALRYGGRRQREKKRSRKERGEGTRVIITRDEDAGSSQENEENDSDALSEGALEFAVKKTQALRGAGKGGSHGSHGSLVDYDEFPDEVKLRLQLYSSPINSYGYGDGRGKGSPGGGKHGKSHSRHHRRSKHDRHHDRRSLADFENGEDLQRWFLLDIQKQKGDTFPFLDLCAKLMGEIQYLPPQGVISMS